MVWSKDSKNKKNLLILLILFIAILIRALLATVFNTGDVLVQLEWAKTIYQQKLPNSYFYPIWTYSPPTQPPLMMLSFWLSQHIYENRYLLAQLHNIIKIPPTFFILWFDKFGEIFLIRLWEIIGDIFSAIIVYILVQKYFKRYWISLLAFISILFSPITIFETSIWGQNDIFSIFIIYISFYVLDSSSYTYIYSPILFVLSLLIKPVGIILLPFYIFYYLYKLLKINKSIILKIIYPLISILISLFITYLLFIPFIPKNTNNFSYINNILFNRISPQSKGVSRASNSAFNFYSLFFQIDYTSGSLKIFNLTLDKYSIFLFIIINIIAIYLFYKFFDSNQKKQYKLLSFILFFISQGSFLFMTGMLERYFFPGFIASVLLLFFCFSEVGYLIIFQHFLWFINMLYAFYLRNLGFIRPLFWNNNYLLTRILSLFALTNFFLIIYQYFFKNKDINNS